MAFNARTKLLWNAKSKYFFPSINSYKYKMVKMHFIKYNLYIIILHRFANQNFGMQYGFLFSRLKTLTKDFEILNLEKYFFYII